jgi:hypothetical protein
LLGGLPLTLALIEHASATIDAGTPMGLIEKCSTDFRQIRGIQRRRLIQIAKKSDKKKELS